MTFYKQKSGSEGVSPHGLESNPCLNLTSSHLKAEGETKGLKVHPLNLSLPKEKASGVSVHRRGSSAGSARLQPGSFQEESPQSPEGRGMDPVSLLLVSAGRSRVSDTQRRT